MNHKIPCDMIQDLLPLYIDGLTSETTTLEIKNHLETCSRCQESYRQMKASIDSQLTKQYCETQKEIDYLKALKNKNVRNVIWGIGATILILLAGIGAKLFFIGSPSESYITTYINIDENQVHIGGTFYDSSSVYSKYRLARQADGSQKLIIYTCLSSIWNRNGTFNLTLNLSDIQQQIEINGSVVQKDGTLISKMANELYAVKNPYIGNALADGRLAQTLKIGEYLGSFKNELQTTYEPYGWTLNFEDSVHNSAVFEAQMKDFACILLALTDNLGEVTWTYMVETEERAVQRQTSIAIEDASAYLGAPVKSFGESPKKIQELLDKLDL